MSDGRRDDVAQAARDAVKLARGLARIASVEVDVAELNDQLIDNLTLAKTMLRQGRALSKYIPGELLADPARYILLDMYVCQAIGTQVSTSSACLASYVPQTTALRWLACLTEAGLIESRPDPHDGRRKHYQLTRDGWQRITAYLDEASMSKR